MITTEREEMSKDIELIVAMNHSVNLVIVSNEFTIVVKLNSFVIELSIKDSDHCYQ